MTSPANQHLARQRALIEEQLKRATERRKWAMADLTEKQAQAAMAQRAVDAAGADVAAMQALLNGLS